MASPNMYDTSSSRKGLDTFRILIVDDHPLIRRGLKATLDCQADLEICGEAAGEVEAILLFHNLHPDLVITDISLEEGNGLELIKQLTAIDEGVKILVLSMCDENLYAERALHAGAKGFIHKHEDAEQLLAAIRRVGQGHVYLSKPMLDRIIDRQVGATSTPTRLGVESLTDRELQVFEQLGHGQTTRQTAVVLELSPKTIESYREKIKAKLKLANATELTQHAVQWVLERNQ